MWDWSWLPAGPLGLAAGLVVALVGGGLAGHLAAWLTDQAIWHLRRRHPAKEATRDRHAAPRAPGRTPDDAAVEVQVNDPEVARGPGWAMVRGLVFAITTGNRYGREVVILNAR